MDEQLTKRHYEEKLSSAIKNNGFYGKNGVWNSIITFNGDKTIYRHRVETIIVKDNKLVFVKKRFNGGYYLPGGSCEKDIPNIEQALNECREEAHINVINIESTGITYKEKRETPNYYKKDSNNIEWDGSYTEVYVGTYDSKYNGHIDKEDQDPFILSGKWYTTKECFSFFRKEHREALLFYLKNNIQNEEPIEESYMSNYFSNKKLIKKISHNPEIERSSIIQMIDVLKKNYSSLSATSKIQRERKREDVGEYFHPILTFDFTDKSVITIVLCFDDSEFTPAAAIHSDEYGDLIVVYPGFFKENKESQIFTLLHEFGHIRLNHLEMRNNIPFFFAKDNNEYRSKLMSKGKVMYPEMNADLYAVLNGASMYSILSSSYNKDTDSKYDYRFTNAELASRYTGVFKQYKKLKKYQESDEEIYLDISKYDIACSTIYEMVYKNDKTEKLSLSDKNKLYSFLYEFAINRNIKNNPSVKKAEKEYFEACENYKAKEALYNKYNQISNSDEVDLSISDIDFKLEIESCLVDEIPVLVNDMYNLENRYSTAKHVLDYSIRKAYNDFMNTYECSGYIIAPISKNINEKSIEISNEKYIIEKYVYELIDKLIDKLNIVESNDVDLNKYILLLESLSTKERNSIDLDLFGIPETRSYPLDTKKHVLSAIRLFGHSDLKYREELAKNILIAMKKYNIPLDIIGEKSKLKEYI